MCGRRAFSGSGSSLFQLNAQKRVFCSEFRPTANKFVIFHTAAENFRVTPLPSVEQAERITKAGQWPSPPPPRHPTLRLRRLQRPQNLRLPPPPPSPLSPKASPSQSRSFLPPLMALADRSSTAVRRRRCLLPATAAHHHSSAQNLRLPAPWPGGRSTVTPPPRRRSFLPSPAALIRRRRVRSGGGGEGRQGRRPVRFPLPRCRGRR